MNTDRRTAAWPVVCTVCWSTRTTRGGRARSAAAAATSDHGAEAEEEQRLGGRAVGAREEDRDDHDRPELAGDARRRAPPSRAASGAGLRRRGSGRGCRARSCSARLRAATTRRRDPPGAETRPTTRPIASEIAQPIVPRTSERRATRCSISSRPGEEEQEHETEVGEEFDVAVDLREAEPLGADEDPEHDLQHDGREDDPAVQPRQNRARHSPRRGRARATRRPAAGPPRRPG